MKLCEKAQLLTLSLGTALWAVPIGDFSPMQTGNSWVYYGNYRTFEDYIPHPFSQYSVIRTFQIESDYSLTDTTVFVILRTDSVYQRMFVNPVFQAGGYRFDTTFYRDSVASGRFNVYQLRDSTLIGGGVFFRSHFYDDSRIRTENINSQNYNVVNDTTRTQPPQLFGTTTASKYIQNIGLYSYYIANSTGFSGDLTRYTLYSFNNNIITSVYGIAANKHVKRFEFRNGTRFDIQGRNLLGRKHASAAGGRH